jgi:hypothetical protein
LTEVRWFNRRLPDDSDKQHGSKRGAELIDPKLPAPNFFIVGAAKAGTTSLHAYLSSHPQVFMPALKEPHYFADFDVSPELDNFLPVIRRRGDYHELFKNSGGYLAVGEASPSYLCDPAAAERIKSAIPTAKIIVSLRNPVERAYSHYLMDFNRGSETLPFEKALEFDLARLEKGWGKSAQYTELGLYANQVESFLRAFGRNQVLVVLFEDLVRDTRETMREIARFLGIDPFAYPESAFSEVHNPFEESRGRVARAILRMRPIRVWAKTWIPQNVRTMVRNRLLFATRPKAQLSRDTRRLLADRFENDLQQLERLLERDLSALRSVD